MRKEKKKNSSSQFANKKVSPIDIVSLRTLHQLNLDHDVSKPHRVQFYIILIIEAGSGAHTVDFNHQKFKKGSVFTIKKGQIHNFDSVSNAKGTLLLFTEDCLKNYLQEHEIQIASQLFNEYITNQQFDLSTKELSEIIELLNLIKSEYKKQQEDLLSFQIIKSYLHVIMLKLLQFKSSNLLHNEKHTYLEDFISLQHYIEIHCRHKKKVMDYASMMGVSTKKLNMITHQIYGKSAKQFIDDIVLIKIKRLLLHSNLTIKEIAYKFGYEDPSNLFKYFKKQESLTPLQFRKTYS